VGQGGISLDDRDDVGSEVGVVACKLVSKGGEDVFELLPVKVIPRAEEAGTKETLLGNCL
jgi:hypothetical protein